MQNLQRTAKCNLVSLHNKTMHLQISQRLNTSVGSLEKFQYHLKLEFHLCFFQGLQFGKQGLLQFCLRNFTESTDSALSNGKKHEKTVSKEKIHLKRHSSIASWGSHHFLFPSIFQLTAQMLSCTIITPGNQRPNEGSSTDHLPGSNHQLPLVTDCTGLREAQSLCPDIYCFNWRHIKPIIGSPMCSLNIFCEQGAFQ